MKKERVNLFIVLLSLFYITIIPCNASLFAFMSTLNTFSLRERIARHIMVCFSIYFKPYL